MNAEDVLEALDLLRVTITGLELELPAYAEGSDDRAQVRRRLDAWKSILSYIAQASGDAESFRMELARRGNRQQAELISLHRAVHAAAKEKP